MIFGLYGNGATSGAGTLRLGINGASTESASLVLTGDVSALVPEQTTLTLLAFAAAGMGVRRWRPRM